MERPWQRKQKYELKEYSWWCRRTVSLCVLVWTGLSEHSPALTGSEGVSVLTFYLLGFALAAGVEGSEEQFVPNPDTPTSPI